VGPAGAARLVCGTLSLTQAQYDAVLAWCNRVRAKLDAPPVDRLHRGKCQDAARCALSRTINHRLPARRRVRVDETDVYRGEDPFEPDEVVARTPRHIERFIREFDRGLHGDLTGRGWV